MSKVVFNLKTFWEIDGKTVNLYDEIKAGRKTSEWRDATHHWFTLLTKDLDNHKIIAMFPPNHEIKEDCPVDLTEFLKPQIAWFERGYPKGSVPRLEVKITKLIYWVYKNTMSQFEVQFSGVLEKLT